MAITINGSAGTITGISAGGLPNGVIVNDDIANTTITDGKLASSLDLSSKTVTLPSGTGGKLVNVAQVIIDSNATHTSNSSYTRFPACDAAYTTTVAGKILVTFNWALKNSGATFDISWKIFRKIGSGSATEILINSSPKSGTVSGFFNNYRGDSRGEGDRVTYSFLDTPGHTAGDVITYEHHFITQGSIQLNEPNQTNGFTATCVSPIVFMEIAS